MTTQNPSVPHTTQNTQSDELAGGAPPTALGPVAAGHTPAGCTPPTGESTPSAGFQTPRQDGLTGPALASTDPLASPALPYGAEVVEFAEDEWNVFANGHWLGVVGERLTWFPIRRMALGVWYSKKIALEQLNAAPPPPKPKVDTYGPNQTATALQRLNQDIAALGSKHTPIEDEAGTVTGWAEAEDVRIGNELDNGPRCCRCNRRASGDSKLCSNCESVQQHFRQRQERLLESKRRHNAEIVQKSPVIGKAARDLMLLDGIEACIGGDENLALHITDEGTFLPVSFCLRLLSNIAHEVRSTALKLDERGCPTQESVDDLIREAAAKLLNVREVPELAEPIRIAIDEASPARD